MKKVRKIYKKDLHFFDNCDNIYRYLVSGCLWRLGVNAKRKQDIKAGGPLPMRARTPENKEEKPWML